MVLANLGKRAPGGLLDVVLRRHLRCVVWNTPPPRRKIGGRPCPRLDEHAGGALAQAQQRAINQYNSLQLTITPLFLFF